MMHPMNAEVGPSRFTANLWSDRLLASAGVPVIPVPVVSVGGGMGSFALVDTLRIAGVPTEAIRVLGRTAWPWETYCQLASASQMDADERIRSDSASAPDCLWGFPGYALREAVHARRGTQMVAPLARVLTEPVLTHFFSPRIRQLVDGMRREAARIGYKQMLCQGEVVAVRRHEEGGYVTLMRPHDDPSGGFVALRSRFVHLAVGYPGLRWLVDSCRYRERPHAVARVVHAYEPHGHVYTDVASRQGTVVVRGAGIAASRILQRLFDEREHGGAPTRVVHVLRQIVRGAHGPHPFLRRRGEHGWAYQGFNWPKATWGGQYQRALAGAGTTERARLYDVLGGTTTARRRHWRRQLERAQRDGSYRLLEGEVHAISETPDGLTVLVTTATGSETLGAQYLIDATGMDGDVRRHLLLADLLAHTGAMRNEMGRLAVEGSFEVVGTRSGTGRLYASGPATMGNGYAPVDTLLGLQYSALRIADELAGEGLGARIGSVRSMSQWWRWVRGVSP